MPVISELEQRSYVGGGDGSADNPYTQEEMDRMLASGTWNGGYVDNLGYVYQEVNVYNGSGNYYTLSSYFQTAKTSGWDAAAMTFIGEVPGVGSVVGLWNQWDTNLCIDMGCFAYEQGYKADDKIFVRRTVTKEGVKYEMIDYKTGNVIVSGVVTLYGYEM